MSVTIQVKRGTEAQIQAATLAIGELAFATDTKSVLTYDGVAKQLIGRALYNTLANRPTYGVAGRLFMDSGTGVLYMDSGSAWISLGSSSHTSLSNIGTNTHAQIDTFISSKASASGLASLSSGSLVVQNPANATATPTASKIPIADGSGKLDGWVSLSGKASTDHDATHITGGSDEIDGDKLDIDWNPSNYTPATVAQTTNVDHLSSLLKGIDVAFGDICVNIKSYGAVCNGTTDDTGALQAALTAIGSSKATVLFPGPIKITSNKTIPSNITLRFAPNAYFVATASTVELTLDCQIDADKRKIFDTVTVLFNYAATVYPEWWGAVADGTTDDRTAINLAFNSLVNGGEVNFGAKTYGISNYIGFTATSLNYTRKLTVRGAGLGKTIIQCNHASNHGLVVSGYSITNRLPYPEIYGITIKRGSSYLPGTGGVGLTLNYTSMAKVKNIQCFEYTIGVDMRGAPNTIMDNVQVNMSQGSSQFAGFNLYCNDTIGNVSSVLTNCWAAAVGTSAANNIGFKIYGDTPMDITLVNPSTAGGLAYGIYWYGGSTGTVGYNSDNHIINPILDAFSLYGIDIEANDSAGAITILGGWINAGAASAQCIRTKDSRNISAIGTQLKNVAHYNNVMAWWAEDCQNLSAQVSIVDCHYGLYWNRVLRSEFSKTKIFSLQAFPFYNAVSMLDSDYCVGSSYVQSGWGITGIYFDSNSSYCACVCSCLVGDNITNKSVNSGANCILEHNIT